MSSVELLTENSFWQTKCISVKFWVLVTNSNFVWFELFSFLRYGVTNLFFVRARFSHGNRFAFLMKNTSEERLSKIVSPCVISVCFMSFSRMSHRSSILHISKVSVFQHTSPLWSVEKTQIFFAQMIVPDLVSKFVRQISS